MSAVEMETGISEEAERAQSFFKAIGRPDLLRIITPQTPLVNVAVEMLPGLIAGGFGALEQDEVRERGRSGIPSIDLTLLVNNWEQKIVNFEQQEKPMMVDPGKLGFERKTEVSIAANGHHAIKLEVFVKKEGSQTTIALHEENIGELYQGEPYEEHRLYQDAVLGFGGYKALKRLRELGVIDYEEPSAIRLNEASSVFLGIAYLDDLIRQGMSFPEALTEAQKKITYTNHTLVPAANASYPQEWYQKYVFLNVSDSVRKWIEGMCARDGTQGNLNLSMLMMELAGRFNGVSKRHAEITSKKFRRLDGSAVEFESVTNGVSLSRWAHPEFFKLYRESGIIDGHERPTGAYREKVEVLGVEELVGIKSQAKAELLDYLHGRIDQYGNRVEIPADAKLAVWARRFAAYKRPELLFFDPAELTRILKDKNIHLIIAGKVHPTADEMKNTLRGILKMVDEHKDLKERVHFIQNYDEKAAEMLVRGADVWINTPEDGYDDSEEDQEACGTSSLKAMPNQTLIISTKSGGMVEIDERAYLRIVGSDYEQQAQSLCQKLREAGAILQDQERWGRAVKGQLAASLLTTSAARMTEDYLNFLYPKVA